MSTRQVLRKPFLVAALALALLAVALEIGASGLLGAVGGATVEAIAGATAVAPELAPVLPDPGAAARFGEQNRPPGLATSYLALFDALLLMSLGLMAASMLISERVLGRVAGMVMLVVALLLIIGGVVLVLVALFALILMVSLFLAFPFGTAAYMAIYGFFALAEAKVVIGLLVAFKLGLGACLFLAHQRFLQNRGLLILLAGSLGLTLLVAVLHGAVPLPLVSITDALGAVVVGIVAVVWTLVVLIGSVVAVGKTVKLRV